MWTGTLQRLLAARPFFPFTLVIGNAQWSIDRPDWLWMHELVGVAVVQMDDRVELVNLALIESIRIDQPVTLEVAKSLVRI